MTKGLSEELRERAAAFEGRPEALIETLHLVQSELGHVSAAVQSELATMLGLTIAQVHGVVTFYHAFTDEPRGRHTIRLCEGTACHVGGSKAIREVLERRLGIRAGETTADRVVTLETVACLGACALAPAMIMDGVYHGKLTPETVVTTLDALLEEDG